MRTEASTGEDLSHTKQQESNGMGEWILAWRDRLLGSPRFQRAAARFPLTRPLARRRARTLFDISAGFVSPPIIAGDDLIQGQDRHRL